MHPVAQVVCPSLYGTVQLLAPLSLSNSTSTTPPYGLLGVFVANTEKGLSGHDICRLPMKAHRKALLRCTRGIVRGGNCLVEEERTKQIRTYQYNSIPIYVIHLQQLPDVQIKGL